MLRAFVLVAVLGAVLVGPAAAGPKKGLRFTAGGAKLVSAPGAPASGLNADGSVLAMDVPMKNGGLVIITARFDTPLRGPGAKFPATATNPSMRYLPPGTSDAYVNLGADLEPDPTAYPFVLKMTKGKGKLQAGTFSGKLRFAPGTPGTPGTDLDVVKGTFSFKALF